MGCLTRRSWPSRSASAWVVLMSCSPSRRTTASRPASNSTSNSPGVYMPDISGQFSTGSTLRVRHAASSAQRPRPRTGPSCEEVPPVAAGRPRPCGSVPEPGHTPRPNETNRPAVGMARGAPPPAGTDADRPCASRVVTDHRMPAPRDPPDASGDPRGHAPVYEPGIGTTRRCVWLAIALRCSGTPGCCCSRSSPGIRTPVAWPATATCAWTSAARSWSSSSRSTESLRWLPPFVHWVRARRS